MTVAQGLIPSLPKTSQTSTVPTNTETPVPHATHWRGTSRSSGSTSTSSSSPGYAYFTIKSYTTGRRETRLSAHIIANATQRIQPLAPVVISVTGPGAHPYRFEIGERTAQPTIIPLDTSDEARQERLEFLLDSCSL